MDHHLVVRLAHTGDAILFALLLWLRLGLEHGRLMLKGILGERYSGVSYLSGRVISGRCIITLFNIFSRLIFTFDGAARIK